MGNFIDILLTCQSNKIDYYEIKGNYRAKVVDVHKGDCISIIIYNNFKFEKHRVIMGDYYIPGFTKRTDSIIKLKELKRMEEAINFVKETLLNKIVTFETTGYDLHGILMGNIKFNKKSLGDIMLDKGFGYPYLYREN